MNINEQKKLLKDRLRRKEITLKEYFLEVSKLRSILAGPSQKETLLDIFNSVKISS